MGILFCVFISQNIFAQSMAITGKIVDANDKIGLPGVSVKLKGTATGTITNGSGAFKITVPSANSTLVFSYVGYQDQEVIIGTNTTLSINLVASDNKLNDVVVVGYGTVRKSDLTGSVSQVKSKELNSFPATNPLQALSGRAAGVQVLQNGGSPGGSVSVRIRGTNSVQGSNEPLYVIDGFPIAGTNPSIINNFDIESMEVLKDASATAIYGSRGANGVVIITTKKGKAGRTAVNLESSYSTQSLRKKIDLMNAQEFATFYNEQAANDKLPLYFTQQQISNYASNSYDWQDLVFTKAPIKALSLNITGGSEKTQFAISGSFFGQDGIIKGSNYDRYSLRTNINHEISKKFSVNVSSVLTRINSATKNSTGGARGRTMISAALSAPPTLTPFNDNGTYRDLATAPGHAFVSSVLTSPIYYLNEETNETRSNRILANAAINYKPIPELTIKISGGVDNADDRGDSYRTRNFLNSAGVANVGTTQNLSLLSENTINYSKTFNKIHSLTALGGFTYQSFNRTTLNGSGTGFISDQSGTYDLAAATTPSTSTSGYTRSALLSYLGRVNYGYNNKYLLTASMRADGSSRYTTGQKWGYFPSAAFAWRISNEDFFKKIIFISDLKLRLGWGHTGSQAIEPYTTLNQLQSGRTVFNDALFIAYAPGAQLPGNLKWETTVQKDLGLDIGLLSNRLSLTADFYIKNTRDLLNTVKLPSSLGFTSTIQNVGEISNKGFELGINGNVLTGKFKWDINANIGINRNKVVKLYGGVDILGGEVAVGVINDNANILREGRPLGQFFGYLEDGYDATGKIKYRDINNDGLISADDKTYIGDPNPNFTYGFNSTMNYKNFELTVFLQGTQGNDLFNVSGIGNTLDYGAGLNMTKDVYLNHWTPTNTNAKYPIPSRNTSVNISNRMVENGSYLRLRNIQLAYSVPVDKLKINWIKNLQIYGSGQNLLTFTKYSWWDPEVNSNGGSNSTSQGFDNYGYPTYKSITFGLRAGF
jgi:TonB-linked SusC/RagA family outer membrane protein